MSRSIIRIPSPLRPYTGGAGEIPVEGATVAEALAELVRSYAGLAGRILDAKGTVRPFVNVFVGETNVRTTGGLDTPLESGSVVSIVPAVAGGSTRSTKTA